MTTTVEPVTPRTRRGVELVLLIVAIAVVLLAWVTVDLNRNGTVPAEIIPVAGGLVVLAGVVHVVLRWKAPYADPVLLPITTALNGLGLVMIHRLDLAAGRLGADGNANQQIIWTALAVALTVAAIWTLRDHRLLRRYTFISLAVGFILLTLPLVPGLGREVNGSRIWIAVGPFSFQPGEFAKIALAVFFAGYLVQTRDVLSLAGKRVLGFTFPRGRDLGPILVAWVLALLILVFEKDLGSALLFFGLFVAMLYVATERVSWIAIGLLLFGAAVAFALSAFAHFQKRVDLWLDPFSTENLERSNQLANGLWGMAAGGLTGTGLGAGRPWLTPFAESDYIFASLAEELGLIGAVGILMLYLLFVERGVRTALGVRDGFGKLLAIGLTFSVAFQLFIVIGGVTRLIPLTGLTTPFLSLGGSSLLANWIIMSLLLRISDQARRPVPALPIGVGADPATAEATQVVRL
ncbi:FtsW/RodA/SpoVE family cell cycle protein [Intrasporangium calvum]|uniref:Cell elongation-specific peptidoglycan biosynthesis regulator RodA n=1 Tax=Intrasporangium calvum (strain ATCC 23552 / DSM 43043 / JCM 3097 / NBRC 12989 / NCIMB 10167 / NRRL B-3866 / 7 KIP) TaxID=710696 RepID=E6SEM6_INTC7|nr:FtsW/RodA/SpoVE family cell cycle protein [Intrasporangium calvum]ADU46627.1 cell elongation-specific peptidoglycan biosynthesis regulator RodA [Intrasporangium calvum DSM 43043]